MRYIVMTRSAKMPSAVKAPYRRVALVKTDLPYGEEPKMISKRARGIVEIVKVYDRCHLGFRPAGNTEAQRVQRELQAHADQLNAL